MESFKSLNTHRINESKESIIRKMDLTEEQKKIAIEFFAKHNAFEKEVDWNKWRTLTWEDLKQVIYKDRTTKSQTKKKIKAGLKGFTEGKDYVILEDTEGYIAYMPFTWEASRMIASSAVPPVIEGESGAKWCTAYQKDRAFWDDHIENKELFIYICGPEIPTGKVALCEVPKSMLKENEDASGSEFIWHSGRYYVNIWDYWDDNDTIDLNELPFTVQPLCNKAEQHRDIVWQIHLKDQANYEAEVWKNFMANPDYTEEEKNFVQHNFVSSAPPIGVAGNSESLVNKLERQAKDALKYLYYYQIKDFIIKSIDVEKAKKEARRILGDKAEEIINKKSFKADFYMEMEDLSSYSPGYDNEYDVALRNSVDMDVLKDLFLEEVKSMIKSGGMFELDGFVCRTYVARWLKPEAKERINKGIEL